MEFYKGACGQIRAIFDEKWLRRKDFSDATMQKSAQ
jgi:hypothetical protein